MVDESVANVRLPRVEARRTLLIGLGTTGARVCGQILERLSWSYDTPDNVPWLRCVVLETAEIAPEQRLLRDHSRVIHLKIEPQQYQNLINNPQNYESQIGFSTWNIPGLTNSGDAITDGAKNMRILGRLALLFPANYTRVRQEITESLARLTSLDKKSASEQFSRAGGEQVQVDLDDTLYVYVIGTLAGGTSSGGFIDMGYMLQNLDGYSHRLQSTGIFMLPSSAEHNDRFMANTYAALVELNHFSSERVRYRQQLPDRTAPVQMSPGTRPYQNLYLVQARGEARVEYAKLVTAAADYVYSDVIGGTADKRDAIRTNIKEYFDQKDVWGATQKYYTFGIGSIEFPYVKVAKACSLKLMLAGLSELSGGAELTQAQGNEQVGKIALLKTGELMRQLLRRQSDSLDRLIPQVLEGAFGPAVRSDDALDRARFQVDAAFQSTASSEVHPDLPTNIVALTIDANKARVTQELQGAIREGARGFLNGAAPQQGLQPLLSYLNGLKKALETGIKESTAAQKPDALSDLQASANNAQEMARQCRRDPVLLVTLYRAPSVKRYVRECIDRSKDYYETRLRVACAPHCTKLYTDSLQYVDRLLNRIDNSQCGFAKDVHSRIEKLQNLLARTDVPYGTVDDGSSRVINGVELFKEGTTIEEEYVRCLRETAAARQIPGDMKEVERRLAREALQDYLHRSIEDLGAEPNEVRRYDPEANTSALPLDDYQLLEFARPARAAFAPLKNRPLIERLFSLPEMALDIQKANTASELLLNWQSGHPRHRDADNKYYRFVFYSDRSPSAAAFKTAVEREISSRMQVSTINDPHQVLILQERGGFSLGTVRELMDESGSRWRDEYNNRTTVSFHSRGDIKEWTTWARTDQEARDRSRNLFLVGVALDLIQFASATLYVFRYTPKGPADSGQVQLGNDLDAAVLTIRATGIQPDLETRIAAYRKENGANDVFRHIDEFIRQSDARFTEGDRPLTTHQIQTYLLDYVRMDTELLDCFRAKYPNVAELRYLKPDKDGRMAYFCPPECGKNYILGYNASDLYMDVNNGGRIDRVLRCALCKRDL
jgi:hypothetical protein